MRSRLFAQDNTVDTFLTEKGLYRILYRPVGNLMDHAKNCFIEAASNGADFLYGDESLLHHADGAIKVVSKPAWSPDTLRSINYIRSPVAIYEPLYRDLGETHWKNAEEWYAFLLRATARATEIKSISQVLFESELDERCNARDVVMQSLRSNAKIATVDPGMIPGSAAVRYGIPEGTRVTCIVTGCETLQRFRRTLESIECRNTYPHLECILVDGSNPNLEKACYYDALTQNHAAKIIRRYQDQNLAKLNNIAAELASGDALLFLTAGVELLRHDTLERMLEYALQPHVGVVGGICRTAIPDQNRAVEESHIIHNVRAITGPIMIRRDHFYETGGFDETYAQRGYKAALCWVLAQKHLFHVFTPYAEFQLPFDQKKLALSAVNKVRLEDLSWFIKQADR
ncbi:MAG: glycosyltransferase [Clostridia bacterium]